MSTHQRSNLKQSNESGRKPPSRKPAAPVAQTADPAALQRAIADPLSASPADILRLQRLYGNRAVTRLLAGGPSAVQRQPRYAEGGNLDPGVEGAIQQARAGGQPLDRQVGAQVGQALGADLSGVQVHTDAQADTLNRSLSAKAFTTAKDIFFRQGLYNPGSSSGKQLLAHELTHVVQQGAGKSNRVQGKLTVGPAGDRYEQEADRVARFALKWMDRSGARPGRSDEIGGVRAKDEDDRADKIARQVAPGQPIRVSRAPAAIQRKVGFEFEDNHWRAWRKSRPAKVPKVLGPEAPAVVYPVKRKEVLHKGSNFQLEGDDTSGPLLTNIEFVTDPFETSVEGLTAFKKTMQEIGQIVLGKLGPNQGKPGPGTDEDVKKLTPPHEYDPEKYVKPDEHRLSGSSAVPKPDVLFSRGDSQGKFKMQATSGISLAELPTVMETYGSQVPGETEERRKERAPARQMMTGKESPTDKITKVLGATPTLAREVVRRMAQDENLTVPQKSQFRGNNDTLVGFISAVMMYMKMLQLPLGGVLKYRIPLLGRSSFVALFKALPVGQQNALAFNSARLLKTHVLAVSNDNPLLARMQGVDVDKNLAEATPLIRSPRNPHKPDETSPLDALASMTIGRWLEGITTGTDYLTPSAMDAWLRMQNVGDKERQEAVEQLESFASIGGTDVDTGGTALGIFENRAINPKATVTAPVTPPPPRRGFFGKLADLFRKKPKNVGPKPRSFIQEGNDLNFHEVYKHAFNYLHYFVNIKYSKGQPGAYPNYPSEE